MKKLVAILFLLLITSVYAEQPATLGMKVHEKRQLTMTGRAADNQAKWVSSDDTVARVINSASPALNGMVEARRPGTATITATEGTTQIETKVVVQP